MVSFPSNTHFRLRLFLFPGDFVVEVPGLLLFRLTRVENYILGKQGFCQPGKHLANIEPGDRKSKPWGILRIDSW